MSHRAQEYLPSATLTSLHFRKRAYQINLCKALAVTVSIFALLSLGFILWTNDNEPVSFVEGYFIDSSKILLPVKDGSPSGGGKTLPGSPLAIGLDGFGGFEGYRISSGLHGVKAAIYRPMPESELEPDMDGLSPGSLKYEESYGFSNYAFEDGIFDYGLPKRDITSDRVRQLPRDPGREVKKIKNETMAIKMQNVKHPQKAIGIRGEVRLMVTIDDGGNILNCEVLYENPPGYGFADALQAAIEESLIFPPVVNGVKVGAKILFTHIFCEGDCPKSISSENIYVFGPVTD
jgi:hypothetical protein